MPYGTKQAKMKMFDELEEFADMKSGDELREALGAPTRSLSVLESEAEEAEASPEGEDGGAVMAALSPEEIEALKVMLAGE